MADHRFRRWIAAGVLVLIPALGARAARVVSVSTCRSVTEPGTVANGATSQFPASVSEIHAVVALAEAKPSGVLRAVWISVDAIDVPNYEIRTTDVPLRGAGDVRVHLSLSNASFPPGHYKLCLYLDGNLVNTTPFSVGLEQTAAEPRPPAKSVGAAPPVAGSGEAQPESRLKAALSKPKAGGTYSTLSGTWRAQGPYGPVTLIFQSPTRMVLADEPLDYTIAAGAFRVLEDGEPVSYPFALRGEALVLSMPEGGQLEFRKVSGSTSPGPAQGSAAGQAGAYPAQPGYGYQDQGGYGGAAQGMSGGSGQEWQLRGRFCTYGGSSGGGSGYSRSAWAEFDGQGNFRYGSESSFSSGAGMAYGGGPGGGGRYRVQGNTILLIYSDGSQEQAVVHVRQNDGSITEVRYGSDLYSPTLCE